MNVSSLFKAAAKKAPPSKDATPEFVDNDLRKNIELFLNAKKNEKKAKSQVKLVEVKILKAAEASRREACQTAGRYFSSIKATANSENNDPPLTVTISFSNKYSDIPTDCEGELRDVFGDDYDKHFHEVTTATLTPIAMNDNDFIATITDAIGAENFAKYFNVKQNIDVKKAYHEIRVLDDALAAKHKIAVEKGLVKCNKPSVKA